MANKILNEMIFKPAFDYIDDGHTHGVLSPFEPGERILKAGTQIAPEFKPLSEDIRMLKDVAVKMRDGVTIYTDIYMPANSKETKLPTLIAWSPYGKSAGTAPRYINLFNMIGMGNAWSSGLTKFEAVDPDYWCKRGYAVCNPDPRGIAHSEGDITLIGSQEAEDCYDLIEWIAQQEWSNKKTALTGTSYLTFSQWFIAEKQPPHLTCINPHEGLSDAYRDLAYNGGIPDKNFIQRLQINHVSAVPGVMREDMTEEMERYPLADAPIWLDKKADISNITIPVYCVASYSNTLHTMGTFRQWRKIGIEDKWLRIHNTQEWPDYYSDAGQEDREKFFDYYLKDIDNGWKNTPHVRYSLLDMEGGDKLNIPAEQFGYGDNIEYTKFYLNGKFRNLDRKASTEEVIVKYDTQGIPGRISFMTTFDEETNLVGYPKLHLYAEVEGADDGDIFVWMQKLDKNGNMLSEITVPNNNAAIRDFTDDGASITCYKGSWGKLRLSMRHLDEKESTNEVPAYSFDRVEKLEKGQVVEADIVMSPIGLKFYKGESIRVIISPKEEYGNGMMPGTPGCTPNNKGWHIIHTGGDKASYLQLPVLKN